MKVWYCNGHTAGVISVGDSEPNTCPVCEDANFIGWVSVPNVGMAGGPDRWAPKMLREMLVKQSMWIPIGNDSASELTRRAFADLIGVLDLHRPLKSNGTHGDLHTPTCGCG